MIPAQTAFNFSTASPINVDRITGQNKRLYDHLVAGNAIHCFHPDKYKLRIGFLNSRCADLIHKNKVPISKRSIKVPDVDGNMVTVIEYSIKNQ